jgi:hypothetical protein
LKRTANRSRRPMRNAWHVIQFLIATALLSGCALPPALMVASYSADIVSYAATGKTVTDHAYSAVARSDCSFIRILHAKPICIDEPGAPQDVQVAQNGAASPPVADRKTAEPIASARDTYVRIGSFLDPANAERSRVHYAAFHAVVVPVVVHGRHFHRVIAGPLSHDEASSLKEKIVATSSGAKHVRG